MNGTISNVIKACLLVGLRGAIGREDELSEAIHEDARLYASGHWHEGGKLRRFARARPIYLVVRARTGICLAASVACSTKRVGPFRLGRILSDAQTAGYLAPANWRLPREGQRLAYGIGTVLDCGAGAGKLPRRQFSNWKLVPAITHFDPAICKAKRKLTVGVARRRGFDCQTSYNG